MNRSEEIVKRVEYWLLARTPRWFAATVLALILVGLATSGILLGLGTLYLLYVISITLFGEMIGSAFYVLAFFTVIVAFFMNEFMPKREKKHADADIQNNGRGLSEDEDSGSMGRSGGEPDTEWQPELNAIERQWVDALYRSRNSFWHSNRTVTTYRYSGDDDADQ